MPQFTPSDLVLLGALSWHFNQQRVAGNRSGGQPMTKWSGPFAENGPLRATRWPLGSVWQAENANLWASGERPQVCQHLRKAAAHMCRNTSLGWERRLPEKA